MTYKNYILIVFAVMVIAAFCEIMGWTTLYNSFGWIGVTLILLIVPFVFYLVGAAFYYGGKSIIQDYRDRTNIKNN